MSLELTNSQGAMHYQTVNAYPKLKNLDNFIDSLIGKSNGQLENKVSSVYQNVLSLGGKLLVGSVALASKFPYIEPNLQLPFPFPVRVTCAATNFLSWLVFECDNGFKIIDEALKTPSEDEKELAPQKLNPLLKTILGISCLSLASISRLPAAFQAIAFNEKKFTIPIAAVVLGAEAIFPTRSLILFAKKALNTRNTDIELKQKQDALKGLITANQTNFIESMSSEEKTNFINEIKLIAEDESDKGLRRKLYLEKLLSKVSELPQQKGSILDTAATITGLFFAANYIAFNTIYAFTGTKDYIWDNNIVAGVSAGLVVITNTYLTGKVITDITKQAFHDIADLFKSKKQGNIAQQFYGNTVRTFQVLTLATSLFSVGAYFEIVSQYFAGNPTAQKYFQVTACIPMFLLLQASANNFINSQVDYWGFAKGSQDKKDIFEMISVFENLSKFIDEMDVRNIDLFDTLLPDSIRESVGFPKRNVDPIDNFIDLEEQPTTINDLPNPNELADIPDDFIDL